MIRYRQLGKIPDARSPDADDAIVAGRVRHCVDRTDYQVKNDLLKLDAIADNWTCNRSDAGLIRLAPFGIQGVSDLRLKNSRNSDLSYRLRSYSIASKDIVLEGIVRRIT